MRYRRLVTIIATLLGLIGFLSLIANLQMRAI